MALERLKQAKTLIGLLARGVRDAMRPHGEDDGFAPPEAFTPPPAAAMPVAEAHAEGPSPTLVTPPPPDPALLESAQRELSDPAFSGMCVVVGSSHVAMAWRTSIERVAAARTLTTGPLALRMIAVRAKGEADVEVETLALGPAENEGFRLVARPTSMLRAIASVGLDGERFVSVAHADAA
jgi:hypothetical protein